jgi:hypothetical protein
MRARTHVVQSSPEEITALLSRSISRTAGNSIMCHKFTALYLAICNRREIAIISIMQKENVKKERIKGKLFFL